MDAGDHRWRVPMLPTIAGLSPGFAMRFPSESHAARLRERRTTVSTSTSPARGMGVLRNVPSGIKTSSEFESRVVRR